MDVGQRNDAKCDARNLNNLSHSTNSKSYSSHKKLKMRHPTSESVAKKMDERLNNLHSNCIAQADGRTEPGLMSRTQIKDFDLWQFKNQQSVVIAFPHTSTRIGTGKTAGFINGVEGMRDRDRSQEVLETFLGLGSCK
ncbi:hypothetical protein CAEBREN_16278 [Caenorhabditis brenneri]|uniref:Uncharacterized protein n=1 Tax=Caenorhabditis brenneri TaxID=135651 RepID=G0ND57_CAEBE|nr:hypothetical protein CAEBREN_16278 [Caenorhabditis brenneri]